MRSARPLRCIPEQAIDLGSASILKVMGAISVVRIMCKLETFVRTSVYSCMIPEGIGLLSVPSFHRRCRTALLVFEGIGLNELAHKRFNVNIHARKSESNVMIADVFSSSFSIEVWSTHTPI